MVAVVKSKLTIASDCSTYLARELPKLVGQRPQFSLGRFNCITVINKEYLNFPIIHSGDFNSAPDLVRNKRKQIANHRLCCNFI